MSLRYAEAIMMNTKEEYVGRFPESGDNELKKE